MATAQQVFQDQHIYLGETILDGIPCSVGYIKKFRWSWMATQLNTFIIIGETNKIIDKHAIETFSSNCLKYALKNHKGWPRGLQSGSGSIAILKGNGANNDAIQFCEKPNKKHWCAFEIPVIYNTTQNRAIRYLKTPFWGWSYFPFFTKTIDSITSRLSS